MASMITAEEHLSAKLGQNSQDLLYAISFARSSFAYIRTPKLEAWS